MKILYIGDVMGRAGRHTVRELLPNLKAELGLDFVIAQAENAGDDGNAPSKANLEELISYGIDFFTGGNHSFVNGQLDGVYSEVDQPIVFPINTLVTGAESDCKIVNVGGKRLLIASFLGQTVGRQRVDTTNPLTKVDALLQKYKGEYDLVFFNFHGDYSSEKRVFGYYLDGRVTAVVGDHWHVPTADAMVFPKGTAHITDVGMAGSLHSSLGVKTSSIIDSWTYNKPVKKDMESKGPFQFNAVLIEVDEVTNLATQITHIQKIIDELS